MKTVQELQLELRRIDGQIQTMREYQDRWTTGDAGKVSRLIDQAEDLLTLIDEAKAREKVSTRSLSQVTSIESGEYSALEHSPGPFGSFGEQMRAVVEAGSPGGQADARLFENRVQGLGEQPSLGGFMIQSDFADVLLGSLYRPGTLLSRVWKYAISAKSNKMSMPGFDETSRADSSRWGGIRAYWESEGAEKTASHPKFRSISMELVKLIGLCYAGDELLEDVPNLGNYLRDAFNAEFTFKLENSLLNGTGAGQPLGVLNGGCLVTISKEIGQAADTIIWPNIVKMLARFKPLNPNKAIWVTNQDCLPQLMQLVMPIGTSGVPVYQPGNQDGINRLCGIPVIYSEASPTLGDKLDLLLMDPQTWLLIEKGGIQVEKSIHVRFIYDESVFRFVYRCNGQPIFASAITPFKGSSNTVSPMVCIAARA